MPSNDPTRNPQPYAVIGAGDLVSHVYRTEGGTYDFAYKFNLFRMTNGLEVTHSFRPEDLRDIVKACQVLAFSIADDGWLTQSRRLELHDLAHDLDAITQNWSDVGNE